MTNLAAASIPFTESRVLHSATANNDYLVSVALPYGHDQAGSRRWPVIFVLDGNWHFGLVVDMVRFMNIRIGICDELPDAIIVGIGYPVTGTMLQQLHQVMHLRMRDFVLEREVSGEDFMQAHFPIPEPIPSGNGLAFMDFLRHEVAPMVEEEYRGDPDDRIVLGHSMGANFALDALFHQPEFFHRAVLASCDAALEHEERFAREHDTLQLRLHLAYESQSDADHAGSRTLADRLAARSYRGLRLTHEAMFSTHCAIVPYAYQSGLVHVFDRTDRPDR